VNKPHLPTWLNTVEVRNLAVGDSRISLLFRREGEHHLVLGALAAR